MDAMLRGWRSTFLTDLEYTNLKEGGRRSAADARSKEDFEDMRLTLQETDYGNFLSNEVGACGGVRVCCLGRCYARILVILPSDHTFATTH